MTHESRLRTIKLGSAAIIGFGLFPLLALITPLSVVMELFLDIAIWPPTDGSHNLQSISERLLIAIVGGLTVGLGVLLYMLADTVYRTDPELGGKIILTGIFGWFIIDSVGSILSSPGGWFNVILNLTFLLPIAVPVLWPSEEARSAKSA